MPNLNNMDSNLLIIYLSVLLAILGSSAWFIVRQILKTRKREMSLERLENKLTQEQGKAQEYYELGSIYLDKNLYSQAILLFQKALKAPDLEGEENIAIIYNALGFAHFGQEQYDIAIRQYKEALKLQPQYVTSLNNLGHSYERKKLTAQALEMYETALIYEPDNDTAKRRVESLRKRLVISNWRQTSLITSWITYCKNTDPANLVSFRNRVFLFPYSKILNNQTA